MLSKEDFEKEYASQLKNDLKGFDNKRKIVMVLNILSFIPVLASFLILLPIAIFYWADIDSMGIVGIGIFGGFGFLLLMKYIAEKIHEPLSNQYHEFFFKPIINCLAPNWQYSINASVGATEVGSSKLFNKVYDDFYGNNLVSGTFDEIDFRSSLLRIEFKKNNIQDPTPQFEGFFFCANINKSFKGETIVVNGDIKDMAEAFRNISSSSMNVESDNHEFNKIFKVKSTNQIEAQNILTSDLMEHLVKIYKVFGGPIRFSFIGNRVYCALNTVHYLFKFSPYRTKNKWEFVEKIYNLFALNVMLLRTFNLKS